MAEKWMQEAFANAHGQFKAAARRASMSTEQYARHVLSKSSKATTHRKRQASLALRGMAAKKKSHAKTLYPNHS